MRIALVHPHYHSGGAEIAGNWPPALTLWVDDNWGHVKQESDGEQRLGSGSAREEAAAPGYRGACQQ